MPRAFREGSHGFETWEADLEDMNMYSEQASLVERKCQYCGEFFRVHRDSDRHICLKCQYKAVEEMKEKKP